MLPLSTKPSHSNNPRDARAPRANRSASSRALRAALLFVLREPGMMFTILLASVVFLVLDPDWQMLRRYQHHPYIAEVA